MALKYMYHDSIVVVDIIIYKYMYQDPIEKGQMKHLNCCCIMYIYIYCTCIKTPFIALFTQQKDDLYSSSKYNCYIIIIL